MKIIGVTKCPTGIAHTYMAAEKLARAGKELGYDVKIETQGSQGTENVLTPEDVRNADYVIIAADVAIDDKDKAVELVEAAKLAFPNLTILSRAWDRRHAYDLLAHGADDVERESFEGSLAMGKRALMRLGFSERRAVGAAAAFRKLDRKLFETLAPAYGQEENYVLASRDSTETMERLLNAEMRRVGAEEEVNDELPFPARRVEKDRQPV